MDGALAEARRASRIAAGRDVAAAGRDVAVVRRVVAARIRRVMRGNKARRRAVVVAAIAVAVPVVVVVVTIAVAVVVAALAIAVAVVSSIVMGGRCTGITWVVAVVAGVHVALVDDRNAVTLLLDAVALLGDAVALLGDAVALLGIVVGVGTEAVWRAVLVAAG